MDAARGRRVALRFVFIYAIRRRYMWSWKFCEKLNRSWYKYLSIFEEYSGWSKVIVVCYWPTNVVEPWTVLWMSLILHCSLWEPISVVWHLEVKVPFSILHLSQPLCYIYSIYLNETLHFMHISVHKMPSIASYIHFLTQSALQNGHFSENRGYMSKMSNNSLKSWHQYMFFCILGVEYLEVQIVYHWVGLVLKSCQSDRLTLGFIWNRNATRKFVAK